MVLINSGSTPVAGLNTYQYVLTAAGPYSLECKSFIPAAASTVLNQGSNLQIVIKQNSTTLVTVGGSSQNPSPAQNIISAASTIQGSVGDTIQFILTSSNAVDSIPNAVKSVLLITQVI